jgi:hypothetical protein
MYALSSLLAGQVASYDQCFSDKMTLRTLSSDLQAYRNLQVSIGYPNKVFSWSASSPTLVRHCGLDGLEWSKPIVERNSLEDPRGATVKLVLKSGRSNCFAGEGWAVPGS